MTAILDPSIRTDDGPPLEPARRFVTVPGSPTIVRQRGISDPRKVFHSFRHTVKDAFRNCEVEEALQRALMGHAGVGEAAKYGHGYSLRRLNDEMQKLAYPDLDLSHLARASTRTSRAATVFP